MKNAGACASCKCEVWIPDALYEAAHSSKWGDRPINFYCGYGHSMVFAKGETDLDKMRRERDRLAQQLAQRDDEIRRQREMREGAERKASAARGQVTKIRNRVKNGVCPCCNRTFSDLHRHMTTKHPEYGATEKAA